LTFGERLKQLRDQKKITQEDFAIAIGFNRSTLANWETDRALPDIETCNKIADYFNVSTDYLLGRSNTPRPLPDPGDIIAAHMPNDDYRKGLPPEAIEEIREHIEFIRYKYRKKQPEGDK
jgi:transcriptional regulator with XRE-family HTH domain